MPNLTRRTQILLDDERYQRLQRRAGATGASIGALIRSAIDQAYPAVPAERAQAARAILELAPMPVDDWPELKREIEGGTERGA